VGGEIRHTKGAWKYIEGTHGGSRERIDLEHGPGELSNLYESGSARASELASLIDAWRWEHQCKDVASLKSSDADKERLKPPGYVE
jgi:hypothetical protein